MRIVVSACLLGENCKYSGGNNYSEKAVAFVQGHEVIPVCPEVLGGLSVPRTPAEIVNGEVVTKDGVSVDAAFRAGAARALAIAKENGVELAILQPRSPSCGAAEVYDGTFTGRKIPGQGVFAALLRENGIRAQLHCEEKKFKQKIAYADKLGIPYVIFLGEDEISSGVVACKDMATGEQTKLEPAATVYRIKAGLAEREKGTVIQK